MYSYEISSAQYNKNGWVPVRTHNPQTTNTLMNNERGEEVVAVVIITCYLHAEKDQRSDEIHQS